MKIYTDENGNLIYDKIHNKNDLTKKALIKLSFYEHNLGEGNMKNFSKILKLGLETANLTQKELSQITGVSEPVISRYAKGTREPKVSMAIKLLNAIYNKVEENEEHQTKGN